MSDDDKAAVSGRNKEPLSDRKKEALEHDTPAHATEQERERLKDFNKDGIPPGSS